MDGIRSGPKRFALFKETFPIYLLWASHFNEWLKYRDAITVDQGLKLNRVALTPHVTQKQVRFIPPKPPPPPPFPMIILLSFNGSPWFLYGPNGFQHSLKVERRFLQLLSFSHCQFLLCLAPLKLSPSLLRKKKNWLFQKRRLFHRSLLSL
jgi:hypothetical protein